MDLQQKKSGVARVARIQESGVKESGIRSQELQEGNPQGLAQVNGVGSNSSSLNVESRSTDW
jgi:hypothetical protein